MGLGRKDIQCFCLACAEENVREKHEKENINKKLQHKKAVEIESD